MGYRSDVGIAVRRHDVDVPDIPTLLALAKTKGIISHDYFETAWHMDSFGWDTNNFVFYVEAVKWYEDDPTVKAMEKLFEFFASVNHGDNLRSDDSYSGVLCRVGEEASDVTEESFGQDWYDLMGVRRSISFDDSLLGNQTEEIKR
jgi:hypothetical protein